MTLSVFDRQLPKNNIKMKVMKNNIKFTLIIFLVSLTHAMAQPTLPGQGTGGGNVEDNPIHFLIPLAIVIGTFLGIKTLKNSKDGQ